MEDITILNQQKSNMRINKINVRPVKYSIAYSDGIPCVWIETIQKKITDTPKRWIVTTGSRSYMFKDTGLFGYTDDKNDRIENSFSSKKEALECFVKYWRD